MSIKTELFLLPIAAINGNLRILVRKDATQPGQTLPHTLLRSDFYQRDAQEYLLRDILAGCKNQQDVERWFASPSYRDRIVDVYDRNLLFDNAQSIAIVRVIAIPEVFAKEAKGSWLSRQEMFSNESLLSDDCKRFAQDCLDLVPHWVRNSTLAFELLPPVFAIQDLRLLVGMLAGQEIDAGNFHRRLKRLDILRPLVSGQRVHRWEFDWAKADILRHEGLIP